MNVNLKKILALLAALMLLVSMAGCLEQTAEGDPAPSTEPSASADNEAESDIDYTLPAIELGGTVITVQDIADMYDDYTNYMQYYGMDVDALTALSYAEESCISSFVNVWQAEVQGITLTDEELAKLEEDTAAYRQSILDDYIAYANEQGTTDGADPEATALELIEQDLTSSYGIGFEEYMTTYRSYAERTALTDKVKAAFTEGISVTDEEIQTWYDETLEAQTAAFANAPTDYEAVAVDFANAVSKTPALVTPEGYVRVRLVKISPEAALDEAYETNQTTMAELEAEYGKLVLAGEDTARQAEIRQEYDSLKAKNDAFYEAYTIDARDNAKKALQALEAGTAFADVMKTFNTAEPAETSLDTGDLLYVAAEAPEELDAALIEAVASLQDGAYSDVIMIGDDYYIVQLVGAVAAGELAFEDCKDLCAAAALADKQESEYTAISDDWYNEALEIAVYHKEAYAGLAAATAG